MQSPVRRRAERSWRWGRLSRQEEAGTNGVAVQGRGEEPQAVPQGTEETVVGSQQASQACLL